MMQETGPILPQGTVDTHFHLFGPASHYPYAEGRGYTPADAGLDTYLALATSLGISRGVIVQPSPYGTDNRRLLDGLAAAPIPMRGVVAVDATIGDAELLAMHRLGVRAIRINLVFDASAAVQTATCLAPRLAELGWHVQFLADVSTCPEIEPVVRQLGLPAVFDHLGHVPAEKGVGDVGFQALLRLMSDGLAWVKASGLYRMSGQGAPHADLRPFVDAVISAASDRVVWATDWPHSAIKVPMPDDAALTRQMMAWLGPDLAQGVFVQNSATLYGF